MGNARRQLELPRVTDSATVVILAGGRDFGRCPIATRFPRALWPVVDRPLLDYQILQLARQGFRRIVACANGGAEHRVSGRDFQNVSVRFTSDNMPRGAAGCVKDAVGAEATGPVVVIEASIAWVPDAKALLRTHRQLGSTLTVFTKDSSNGPASDASPAGIYVCEPEALSMVSACGYQDIKEQLIPALLRMDERVLVAPLPGGVVAHRGLPSYLAVVGQALAEPEAFGLDLARFHRQQPSVWSAEGVHVDPSARLYGPLVLLEGARIDADSVVVGPAVLGRRARVGEGATVDASVLWEGAVVGSGAYVQESLLDVGASVRPGVAVRRQAIADPRARQRGAQVPTQADVKKPARLAKPVSGTAVARSAKTSGHAVGGHFAAGLAVVLALIGAYRQVFVDLWGTWMRNDNYSSGLLVPFLAAYLVISRRAALSKLRIRPTHWGLVVVALGFAMRFAGSFLMFGSAERLSLVIVVVGVVLTLFGLDVTRRLGWVLAFLLLMLPWPNRVYNAVSLPLQSLATRSTVFLLETLGYVALREGNIIHVEDTTVAVAEACSGLRMLTAFMIVAALIAFLCRRSFWEKVVLVASSVPIAIACNTLRLTATSVAFAAAYGETVNTFFHDFGGIVMMPLALAMLAGELWVMKSLFPPAPDRAHLAAVVEGHST